MTEHELREIASLDYEDWVKENITALVAEVRRWQGCNVSAPVFGDFIRYRARNGYAYSIMTNEDPRFPAQHLAVDEDRIPRGALINECVWKDRGTRMEVRRTYIKRVGPRTYVPMSTDEATANIRALCKQQAAFDLEVDRMMADLGKIFGF